MTFRIAAIGRRYMVGIGYSRFTQHDTVASETPSVAAMQRWRNRNCFVRRFKSMEGTLTLQESLVKADFYVDRNLWPG